MSKILSIIIPMYNASKYILETLEILKNSKSNFEVIIVDDASIDNSLSLVSSFIENLPKKRIGLMRVIKHKTNKGLSESRNSGLRVADSNYVYFLDADDYLFLDELLNIIESVNEYTEIIHFGYSVFTNIVSENHTLVSLDDIAQEPTTNGNGFLTKQLISKRFEAQVWQRCYKLSYLRDNNFYFKSGIYHEDEEWSIEVLLNASNILDLSYIEIYCYRTNDNSITRDNNKIQTRAKDLKQISLAKIEKYKYFSDDILLKKLILDYYARLFLYSIQLLKRVEMHNLFIPTMYSYFMKTKIKSLFYVFYFLFTRRVMVNIINE